ncbi:hypothetical protein Tco_0625906 [Tanacetum coccineum]|uniref:Zinc finger, CCHC-type n=1 Tax=Tanacetum coccineum TaxID=301880 RepID=A0ABQ4WI94_9ASTR
MPHTLKMFEQAKLMGSSTHSIPPLAYENNFGYGRTHYYQSLLLGNEYKGGGRGIRILMRLENEVMYSKRKEDGVGAMGKSRKGMRLRAILTASVQKCLESTEPYNIVLATSMKVIFFFSATPFCSVFSTSVGTKDVSSVSLVGTEESCVDEVYFAFGWHLDDLHVTWAHLEKKRTRLRTNTKILEDLSLQTLETASEAIHDAVAAHQATASQDFTTASARADSKADLEDSSHDGVTPIKRRRKRDCVERIPASIFSLCYLFRNSFLSTTMGDENPIRTLGDYSRPSHEGYRNTIELPAGNNVVPLRSDTIRLVQNGCSFHGLWSEDPNQHLKDFLKLVDSLDLDGENRERMRLRLFQFSLRDQASNWLERLPAGSISTWEDLTTRFLPTGKDSKTPQ